MEKSTQPPFESGDMFGQYSIGTMIFNNLRSTIFESFYFELREPVAFKIRTGNNYAESLVPEIETHQIVMGLGRASNVAMMLDYGYVDDDTQFIVTPLQESGTLARRLSSDITRGRVQSEYSMGVNLGIVLDAAIGLSDLHRLGLVHCDVKGQNIGINKRLEGRLLDLELMHPVDRIRIDQPIGTRGLNIPPEGYDGEISTASDVWALGAVTYQAATGRLPFSTKRFADYRKHKAAVDHYPEVAPIDINPQRVAPEFSDCVMAMLSPRPENRPSIEEFIENCQGIL